ncbi:TniQ family protein (plasmid) [Burkholderia gladioli pv. gladioli]|uniref:TniQ family protein n=1 Tax=Burkholderia gladioli TaxID=28095 RepID=UPI0024BC99E6|nr:TniQ family protein [Burkholderia gladioli]MDJ1167773.1 TniQ family protein [Burkholderia gladioli pv. gladioli]
MTSGSNLLLFPASLPDEALVSRVSRYHILTRNRKTRDSFMQLFGKPRTALTDIVPPDIPCLASRLPGDSRDNLERLLNDNTMFPLATLFNSWTPPTDWTGAAATPASIRRRTLGLAGLTKICEHCLREDFNTHGSTYIHRAHQAPGVICCWRHRTSLIERCPECSCPFEQPREFLEVPWKPCACGYRLGSDVVPIDEATKGGDPALGYAVFVRGLLLAAPGSYSTSVLASTCRTKLVELGLSRGQRGIDRHAAAALLEDYYGADLLRQMDTAYAAGKRDQWFRMGSRSGTPDVPLNRHLLTAHFLFVDAGRFVQALDTAAAEALMPATPTRATLDLAGDAQQPNDKVNRAVGELRRALEENPRYTLEDLWSRYRGTLTRLLKWDRKAFAQIRDLAQKSRSRQPVAARVISPHRLDGERADQLRQAALKLYASTDRPARISKYSIVRAAKLAHVVSSRAAYPQCNEVLDGFAETQWHFYARRYLWTLAHLPGAASASEVRQQAGIWHYKFVELDAYFRARSLTQVTHLREGQVIVLLRSHGIDLKWEGPCPDKIFARPGRAYVKKCTGTTTRHATGPSSNNVPTPVDMASVVLERARCASAG